MRIWVPILCLPALLAIACSDPEPSGSAGDTEAEVADAYLYEKILSTDPADADAHFHLGNARARQERLEEAEYHWRQAIALDPNHSKAQINLALLLRKQGRSR